jgi:23S rRNA pseudouridine1911/1915/1917 synthase
MSDRGFDILLEDDALLAVVKPAGIATQAPPGIESLESRIKAYLAATADAGDQRVYLGIPHRLDRPVSGSMVFAKTRRAARYLARQFEKRRVRKLYWACVQGTVEPAAGTWTDHLCKIHGQPKAMVVDSAHPDGRHAILHYRTIGSHRHGCWLEIELETGRTHQVRVQAASRGFPILGDTYYNCQTPFGPQCEDVRQRQIALHARSLAIRHPISHEEQILIAEPNESWNDIAREPAV